YYGARYYDPQAGRFTSVDTVEGNTQGMDPYGYVGGNPVSRTDPSGRCFLVCAVIGAVAGAVIAGGISYGAQVVNNYVHHDPNPWGFVDWAQIGIQALGGAGVGGLAGATMGASLAVVPGAAGAAGGGSMAAIAVEAAAQSYGA